MFTSRILCYSFHSASKSYKYVEKTAVKYPLLKRKNFAALQSKDIEFFQKIIGSQHVLTDQDAVAPYNVDWMCSVRGIKYNSSKCLL